jgi:drug/metabolite transporter (DMT)-like permease
MERRYFIIGMLLVLASAVLWSLGGTFARFVTETNTWTSVFWRSYFATVFLICFMVWQGGLGGAVSDFRRMGWPGYAVACCFAGASVSLVVGFSYTTVANIILMQAGVPLIAALMAFLIFRERVTIATWIAIVVVLAGVAIMVSDSFTGLGSPIGTALSLNIAVLFAIATVMTRHYSGVRMTPAVTLGVFLAMVFAAIMGGVDTVTAPDLAWLFAFGALNLGLGLACFALGVRAIPAAVAALIGTIEPVFAPLWVWLIHGEVPSGRTLIGGGIVCVALITHILVDMFGNQSAKRAADA